MNTRKLSLALRNIPVEHYRLPDDGRKSKAKARDRQSLANWLGTFGDGDGTRIAPGIHRMMLHFQWSHGKVCYLLNDLKKLKLLESPLNTDGKWQRFRGEKTGTRLRKMNITAFLGEVTVQDSAVSVQNSAESPSKIEQSPSKVTLDGTDTRPTQITPPYPPAAAGGEKTVAIHFGGRRIEVTLHSREERRLFRRFWTKERASTYIGAQVFEVITRLCNIGLDAKDSAQKPAIDLNWNLMKTQGETFPETVARKQIVLGR